MDVREAPSGQLPATQQQRSEEPTPPAVRSEQPDVPKATVAPIAKAIVAVMRSIQPIVKKGKNAHFGYKFDKMEDILLELTPLIAEHGLAIIPDEVGREIVGSTHCTVTYEFTIIHADGAVWPHRPRWTGMSLLKSERGGFDDKAINKCSTQASKFFLKRLFNIPTEDGDDEDDMRRPTRQKREPAPGPAGKPPHHIDPVKGEKPETWQEKYLSAIRSAKTIKALVAWQEDNQDLLEMLEDQAPKLAEAAQAVFDQLRDELGAREPDEADKKDHQAKKDPPKSNGPGAPTVKRPDAAEEPEAFLKWIDEACGKISNGELLEEFWNQRIDPDVQRLRFPSDQEEAAGIFRRHEERFAP